MEGVSCARAVVGLVSGGVRVLGGQERSPLRKRLAVNVP